MRCRIKIKNIAVYAAYAAGTVLINFAAGGAPLSLGLCFAMLACGANIFAVPAIYVLASVPSLNWVTMLISLYEGAFLCGVTAIYRRAHRKIKYAYAAVMAVAMAPFVAFSPWEGIRDLGFTDDRYIIKAVAAAAVIVFSLFCLKAVYAMMYRLFRCRLKSEEYICLAVLFTVAGIGFYNACGLYVYLAAGCGAVVFCVRLTRSPAALAIACAAGLPLLFAALSLEYIALFCLLACAGLLFACAGRGAPSAAAMACGAIYFYLSGAFTQGVAAAVINALTLAVCCLAPALPTDRYMSALGRKFFVRDGVPELFEARLRDGTSRKLFKTSQVFREIQSAFLAFDEPMGDDAVRARVLAEIRGKLCTNCDRRQKCAASNVYDGFERLMHSGCIKGKVSLVDLPAEITVNCAHPSDVMNEMNRGLARMKRMAAEAESARSGRLLLANQAKGISEVLKSAAVDIAREGARQADREKAVEDMLTGGGICATEVKICGDGGEVYLTIAGKAGANTLAEGLKAALGRPYILRDRLELGPERTCYLFVRPPEYDAAFGVACAVKDGERASGDTHSVIKINEHAFLMALCDGMGSGAAAHKVSSTTISLVEAFFRAEMPCKTILETINKLMTFNRDESFTCMDIASVDLNTLSAGFIKIGSPPGIIIKKDGIKVMESASLPLGILDSIRPTVCEERLDEDDTVVFMSDGITSAFPSATDMYGMLERLRPLNPQSAADGILAAAKKAAGGRAADDMTVLAVRIFKNTAASA